MSKNKQNYLKIGELAKKTGLAISALRYYEDVGLLIPHHKSSNKYRFYTQSDVALVLFIKKSQVLGFSLDEIKEVLDKRSQGQSPCPKVKEIANKKIKELHEKISELELLENQLKEYITESHFQSDSFPDDPHVCKMIDSIEL